MADTRLPVIKGRSSTSSSFTWREASMLGSISSRGGYRSDQGAGARHWSRSCFYLCFCFFKHIVYISLFKLLLLLQLLFLVVVVVFCKLSEEDTIVLKANEKKSIEVKTKSKSINVVEPEEKPKVTSPSPCPRVSQ